jgi:hypothetical protein
MPELSEVFSKDLEQFKGDIKQVDDILLIGIEF